MSKNVLEGLYLYTGESLGNSPFSYISSDPVKSTQDIITECWPDMEDADINVDREWTEMSEIDFANDWSVFAIDSILINLVVCTIIVDYTNITKQEIVEAIQDQIKD